MKAERFSGFAPFYNECSRVLVLGSFPSVKSRKEGFYYGNPQNRFWKMLSRFFGEPLPTTVEDKQALLLRNKIALWDMVLSCEIIGSSDASIRDEDVADLNVILGHGTIECVLCNGTKSYDLLSERFPELLPMTKKMPSTSPANPRYEECIWHEALAEVFAVGAVSESRKS